MSVASISPVQATAQQVQNTYGLHHHRRGANAGASSSTGIASMSTLMNAAPASSSTSISTVASTLFKLPGLSTISNAINTFA